MPKTVQQIIINEDERYPFFLIAREDGDTCFVHPDRIKRWRRVMREFECVQGEMEYAVRESEKADRLACLAKAVCEGLQKGAQ